jgi:hypothetical protein
MAQTSPAEIDRPSIRVVQKIEILKGEIAQQEKTVQTLSAAGHETRDAARHLESLRVALKLLKRAIA